jgi:hypothetical protein
MSEWFFAWRIAGRSVLNFFWSRYRRARGFTLVRPGLHGGFEREALDILRASAFMWPEPLGTNIIGTACPKSSVSIIWS